MHYFVGGATKLYGAALYRLREEDFGELRHHDGISPAWPISYDELEPYYTRAEQLYEVHGARGEDPTEPPASAPYPFPAVSHEPRIQQLADDLAAAGHHPFHAPCGVRLLEANMPYSACVRCQNCDGFPCAVHGKSDAEVLGVRPALEHANVTLLTNARAVRLETNDGRHRGRRPSSSSGPARPSATRATSSSSRAARPTRRRCCSPRRATGIRTGSPTAPTRSGATTCSMRAQAVLALSREENPTVFQKTLGLNDFYFSGGDDFEFPLGSIQMIGKSQAPMFRGEKPVETLLAPAWSLEKIARHAVDFWLSTEDLPRPENRVTLTGDGSVRLAYKASNDEPKAPAAREARVAARAPRDGGRPPAARATLYMKNEIPVAGCAHQAGTCRFGTDPASSVLDVNCKAHELDNLYVVDTSFFPSIGAVNPALTAMANALRVGDHLRERLGANGSRGWVSPPASAV